MGLNMHLFKVITDIDDPVLSYTKDGVKFQVPGNKVWLEIEVADLDKSRAIHNWLRDLDPESDEVELDENDLKRLKKFCKKILEDNSRAAHLIPYQDYDELYFYWVANTFKILDELELEGEYLYRSGL